MEQEKYKELKSISKLMAQLSYVVFAFSGLAFFVLILQGYYLYGLVTIMVGLILGLLLISFAKLVPVFIDIEINTNKLTKSK